MNMQPNPPRVITLSERIYAALLTLYPAAFRLEYGAQMTQIFHDVSRDSYRRQGAAGIVLWWYSALLDLIFTAIDQWKEGKPTMSSSLSPHMIKGSGLGLMCTLGGLIYIIGGLWLSVAGAPTDPSTIELTHLLRMMWAGGATCGLMGLIVLEAIDNGYLARSAALLSTIGFVIAFFEALVALIVHNPVSAFTGSLLPFSGLSQFILLIGWGILTIVILRANRWKSGGRFAPLAMLLSPFVGLLLSSLLGNAFVSIVIMGLALLLMGIAVQIHLDEKRRAINQLSPAV